MIVSESARKGLVFGSLNLDYVYEVDHFVYKGETLSSSSMICNPGGKGLNQAIALAKAGGNIYIAGSIGRDGLILKDTCEEYGVKTDYLQISNSPTGNAIIQVDRDGNNCILLFPGANKEQNQEAISKILNEFEQGDYLFLQNEINEIEYLISQASHRGMKIVLNPSPFEETLMSCGLEKLDWLILNEIEAMQMTGKEIPEEQLKELKKICPNTNIVLTLGEKGSICSTLDSLAKQECIKTNVVDTTAAGDTFTGFFFAHIMENGGEIEEAMLEAAQASAISVSRKGAAQSIPYKRELE